MGLFYKPKHYKKRFKLPQEKIHAVTSFILGEINWYLLWWVELFIKICHKLYCFGELIIRYGIKFIDFHNEFWDRIEASIEEKMNGMDESI